MSALNTTSASLTEKSKNVSSSSDPEDLSLFGADIAARPAPRPSAKKRRIANQRFCPLRLQQWGTSACRAAFGSRCLQTPQDQKAPPLLPDLAPHDEVRPTFFKVKLKPEQSGD